MLPAVYRSHLVEDHKVLLIQRNNLTTSVMSLEEHMTTCKDECHWMERALGLHAIARIDQLLTELEDALDLKVD